MENRQPGLDIGRAFATMGVIAVHVSLCFPLLPGWARVLAQMGQFGVQLFFVISAVTIFMTLDADVKKHYTTREVTLRFYVKRFFRTAPLYYCAIALYACVDWLARSKLHATTIVLAKHDISDILANILFVHTFVPSAVNDVVPGGWSIGEEMLFYAAAPLLFFFIKSPLRMGMTAAGIVAACFMAISWASGGRFSSIANDSYLYFWPATQIPCFVIGIWLWFAARPTVLRGAPLGPMGIGTAFALIVAGLTATLVLGTGREQCPVLAPVASAIGAAGIIAILSGNRPNWLNARPLLSIGRESYGIYVSHFIFIFLSMRLFSADGPLAAHSEVDALIRYPLVVAATIVLSYGCARLCSAVVQHPVDKVARLLLSKIPPDRTTSSAHYTVYKG
ncbi:acyltransferase [Trinickia symbiotica]|uniref:Acyltransferase n=1 Tax=Trinickia symbiotica TaxID=863227 RepID=A0A2T3XVP1_9BURK|nr:acyltransferase [Trinickia symbiotica]PTB20586.1 acyltransferase [Trinickia symbiotica]